MQLIENARESFESIPDFIPTNLKIQYLNQLMELGYYSVDFGTYDLKENFWFSDLNEVISAVDKKNTGICVRVENEESFLAAIAHSRIDEVEISYSVLKGIGEISVPEEKIIVGYSLDFAGESGIIKNKIEGFLDYCVLNNVSKVKFYNLTENLNEEVIKLVFEEYKKEYPEIGFRAHFYAKEAEYRKVFDILYDCRCQFLEVSINGWGKSKLGNTSPTEKVVTYLVANTGNKKINPLFLESAYNMAKKIFSRS